MSCCSHKYRNELRLANIYMMLVSLTLFMAALFMTAILPSLLLRYVYAGQELMAEPKALEMIPVVSFAIATAYFIYAVIVSTLNELKAKRMGDSSCCSDNASANTELSDSDLAELEALVDEAIAEDTKPKTRRKVVSSSKRSSGRGKSKKA